MIPQQRDPDGPKGTEHELTAPDQSPPDLGGGGGGLSPFMILLREFGELKGLVTGALTDHSRKIDDLERGQSEHSDKIQTNATNIALVNQQVQGIASSLANQGPRKWQAIGAWAGALSAAVALVALIVALRR